MKGVVVMPFFCKMYGGECIGCRECCAGHDSSAEPGAVCEVCGCVIAPGETYYDIGNMICMECIEEFVRYA